MDLNSLPNTSYFVSMVINTTQSEIRCHLAPLASADSQTWPGNEQSIACVLAHSFLPPAAASTSTLQSQPLCFGK